MELVRRGDSWSGGERNRVFLNGGDARFIEMSRLAGLDYPDDGRGLAVVDWDQDGRLDLWFRNRTAPRLRLMKNRRGATRGAIALRLEGVEANRDGVGAVVELLPAQGERGRSVRSVRAGDLFLSQSSKWLHFGTAGIDVVESAEVLWPGGERERFRGLSGSGRFVLRQGEGVARPWQPQASRKASVLGDGEPLAAGKDDGRARILLPSRIPLPRLSFRDQLARPAAVIPDGRTRLLVLWSADCRHCKEGLREIAAGAAALRVAQLEVLVLSVDGTEGLAADTSGAYDLIDETAFPFPWGLIDAASAGRLQRFQAALFDRTPPGAVPLAILLDQGGNAVAIYRGPLEPATVIADWKLLRDADEKQLYHLAPPMAGTWFTNPLRRDEVIRLIGSMME